MHRRRDRRTHLWHIRSLGQDLTIQQHRVLAPFEGLKSLASRLWLGLGRNVAGVDSGVAERVGEVVNVLEVDTKDQGGASLACEFEIRPSYELVRFCGIDCFGEGSGVEVRIFRILRNFVQMHVGLDSRGLGRREP